MQRFRFLFNGWRGELYRTLIYVAILLPMSVIAFFWWPAVNSYTITETYTFQAGDQSGQVWLGVLLPVSQPYQTVSDPVLTWHGDSSIRLKGTMQLAEFNGLIPANRSLSAQVQFTVDLPQGSTLWQANARPEHTAATEKIEANDAGVMAQAMSFTAQQQADLAYEAYVFTAGWVKWPTGSRTGETLSAAQVYQEQVGGCNEFARLYTALLRARGIPAQTVSGLAMPDLLPWMSASSIWNHPAGAHAWTEFALEDGWRMADASWASSLPVPAVYYGRNDGRHLFYAEESAEATIHDALFNQAEQMGQVIGAMSAPLKFAAGSDSTAITIQPQATVTKGWDGKLFNLLVIALGGGLGLRLVDNRMKRFFKELEENAR